MPPQRRQPSQEALLVTGSAGQIRERDFSGEQAEVVVDPIAHNIHLLNVLDTIANINQLEGLIIAAGTPTGRPKLEREFGTGIDQVVANAQAKQSKLGSAARWEFARAHGMFDRIDAGIQTPEDAKAGTRVAFDEFVDKYAHLKNVVERDEYRARLADEIKALQDAETLKNQTEHLRPHKVERKAVNKTETLESQGRLMAISADPRAGFLPTTHTEKTTVMAMLDYLDNPKHPIGIRTQLLEFAGSHMKIANDPKYGVDWRVGKQRGIEAARSKTFELGDFLADADKQLEALKALQLAVYESDNPNVMLAEQIGSDHPAYVALARYKDLKMLRDKGVIEGLPYSPLKPHRNEEDQDFEGKNKVIEDPYTRKDIDEAFAQRIVDLPISTTVGQSRSLITEVIEDTEKRSYFHAARLEELDEKTGDRVLRHAYEAARLILTKRSLTVVPVDAVA